jgi:hypothetical protein
VRGIYDGTITVEQYRELLLNLRQEVVEGGHWIARGRIEHVARLAPCAFVVGQARGRGACAIRPARAQLCLGRGERRRRPVRDRQRRSRAPDAPPTCDIKLSDSVTPGRPRRRWARGPMSSTRRSGTSLGGVGEDGDHAPAAGLMAVDRDVGEAGGAASIERQPGVPTDRAADIHLGAHNHIVSPC